MRLEIFISKPSFQNDKPKIIHRTTFLALNLFGQMPKCYIYYITHTIPQTKMQITKIQFGTSERATDTSSKVSRECDSFTWIKYTQCQHRCEWAAIVMVYKMSKWLSLNNQRNLVMLSSYKYEKGLSTCLCKFMYVMCLEVESESVHKILNYRWLY